MTAKDRFIEELERVKAEHPELRYGQIISATLTRKNRSYDAFYLEDDTFAELIELFRANMVKSK